MNLSIQRDLSLLFDPVLPLANSELRNIFEILDGIFNFCEREIILHLVNDAKMADLNTRFLACTGPTNVLAFPDDAEGRLGEIALSVDTLAREIQLYAQIPVEHTVRLLAHASLHLLGFEHGAEMDMLTQTAVNAVCVGSA